MFKQYGRKHISMVRLFVRSFRLPANVARLSKRTCLLWTHQNSCSAPECFEFDNFWHKHMHTNSHATSTYLHILDQVLETFGYVGSNRSIAVGTSDMITIVIWRMKIYQSREKEASHPFSNSMRDFFLGISSLLDILAKGTSFSLVSHTQNRRKKVKHLPR